MTTVLITPQVRPVGITQTSPSSQVSVQPKALSKVIVQPGTPVVAITVAYGSPAASNAGGLTNGDKGDVVVSMAGEGLIVESATPADGIFDVVGEVAATKGLTLLGAATLVAGVGQLSAGYLAGAAFIKANGPSSNLVDLNIVSSQLVFGDATGFLGSWSRATGLVVVDQIYDATAWDGNFSVPTKNAVRDKIESMSSGGPAFPTPATRAALAALATSANAVAILAEAGREGTFIFRTGDYSARVTSDAQQGLYVPPTAAATGASGAWVRQWDGINGKPEWFGALINDGAADNRTALLACQALCPVTRLTLADYYITGRLNLTRAYRALLGPLNPDGYATGNGPRIISTLTSADVARVGPAAAPASTNDFLRNVTIKGITFMHVGARTLPAAGAEKSAVAGLRCEYLIDSTVTDNYANEPLIGFVYLGCVGTHLDRNRVFRSALFGGNDFCIGHLLTGGALSAFGLVGNNASYFASKWNASIQGAALGLVAANRVGMWWDGAITDGFNNQHETLGCGMRITGLGAADVSAGNGDYFLRDPIIDQYDGVAIEISGIAKTGHVRIIEPYMGCPAATPYGMRVRDSAGAVTIRGGDLYGTPSANQTIGVNIENSTGSVVLDGTVLHEMGRPVTVINSPNVIIKPRIINHSNTSPAYQAAVALVNVQRGTIAPVILGKANSFPQGIMTFDAICSELVIDPTGIDAAAISGGSANRVIVNGQALTAPGYYSAAGAPTTLATGILVTGSMSSSIPAIMKPVTLVDAVTVTIDGDTGINFNLTLGGNRTLANPINMKVGQSGRIRIKQDATGSRTLTFGANWLFAGGDPTMSTPANTIDVIAYFVNAANEIEATFVKALA